MAYLLIKDFRNGMDRRRPKSSGVPGSLWLGKNVHLTRGGDIENAKKFVPTYNLPVGTFGMGTVRGQIFVFGSANLAANMPPGVQYQRLQNGAANMIRVLDAKPFNGLMYVIAEFDDGGVYHFYNGVRIADWDTISDANATFSTLAEYLADKISNQSAVDASAFGNSVLITARVPGTAFTIAKSTVNNGATNDQDITLTQISANQPETAAVRATGTLTVTGGSSNPGFHRFSTLTINAVNILPSAVDWTTSNSNTAALLAAAINANEVNSGYSATVVGATVTVKAAEDTGTTPNGYAVAATVGGDVTYTSTPMTGGAAAIEAGAQIFSATITGTLEKTDKFTITINGIDYSGSPRGSAAGTSLYVNNKRVYSPAASLLRYCKINDPTNWTDASAASGAGFLAVSSDAEGYERVIGAAPYNLQTGVFGRGFINLYTLGTDASLFALDQPIENTGARSAKSIKTYGNNELFYLDDTGIRSLRARASNDAPYTADVGSAIDDFVKDHMVVLGNDKVSRAVAAIEPSDGRFWLAMGERIYVLSFFPGNKISAWTYYEPGFEVSELARVRDRMYVRAADTIYLYGGADGQTYPEDDEITCTVEIPYVSGETPATKKMNAGVDFDLTNEWFIKSYPDPNRQTLFDTIGRVNKITYGQPSIALPGVEPTWSFTFECSKGGRATISSIAIHYDAEEAR